MEGCKTACTAQKRAANEALRRETACSTDVPGIKFVLVPWSRGLFAATLFLAAGVALWHAALVRSRRNVPGSYTFMWLLLAIAHWSLTSAISQLVEDADTLITIAKIQYLAIGPISLLWALFAARYARLDWPSRLWVQALLIAEPILTIILAATNERHGLLWASVTPIQTPMGHSLLYTGGPWYWVHVAYSYTLLLVGARMVVRGLRNYPPPYRRQRWAVVLGLLAPWLGNVLYLLRLPAPGIDLTPLGFAASGLCLSWGVYRYRMFGLVPAARDMVVDSMEDGVFVLDSQRRMVDLNPAAERLTGVTHAQAQAHIETLLGNAARQAPPNRRGPRPVRVVELRESLVGNVRTLLLVLLGVVGLVLLSGFWKSSVVFNIAGTDVGLPGLVRDIGLIIVTLISLRITPAVVHDRNQFSWAPMQEVAKLFAGIFLTIIPVIAMLKAGVNGPFGAIVAAVTRPDGSPDPAMYFWATGALSSFLDNAPTYLVFFNTAGGDPAVLMSTLAPTLAAISAGAVFMGANTYIGNAPNLMVKAIAEDRGVKMPSFFGYMLWSGAILVPLFIIMTLIWFR